MRRRLLRPIRRRSARANRVAELTLAVATLDVVADGSESLSSLAAAFKAARATEKERTPEVSAADRAWVNLARALLNAQRISWAQYVFTVGAIAEGLNEGRWFRGDYDRDLPSPRKDPSGRRYAEVLDRKLYGVFEELGEKEVSELWRTRRSDYDTLREQGRRYYFHADELRLALRYAVTDAFDAARDAAAHGGFRAAVTLLGSALEGLLLERCLRSPRKARAAADALPRRLRARANGEFTSWSFEVLIEVCSSAGWLRRISTPTRVYHPEGLAHSLRAMRNWIHPGREAKLRPWQSVYEKDYSVAVALYQAVEAALSPPRPRASRHR